LFLFQKVISSPWFVTDFPLIPLKSKVSLPKNLPLKSFHFPKLFCVFSFLFVVGSFHFANTRREFMVPRHAFTILFFPCQKYVGGNWGVAAPKGGVRQRKLTLQEGKKEQRKRQWDMLAACVIDFYIDMVLPNEVEEASGRRAPSD